jgi:hypothetical protein
MRCFLPLLHFSLSHLPLLSPVSRSNSLHPLTLPLHSLNVPLLTLTPSPSSSSHSLPLSGALEVILSLCVNFIGPKGENIAITPNAIERMQDHVRTYSEPPRLLNSPKLLSLFYPHRIVQRVLFSATLAYHSPFIPSLLSSLSIILLLLSSPLSSILSFPLTALLRQAAEMGKEGLRVIAMACGPSKGQLTLCGALSLSLVTHCAD